MKYILIAIISFVINLTQAQSLKLIVKNAPLQTAFIYSLNGETTALVDSIKPSSDGEYSYNFLPVKYHEGFYRINIGSNLLVDFVYDGKNIEINTNANDLIDSLKVITSESNKLYYSFVKLNKKFKEETQLLNLVIERYPKNSGYYLQTKKELNDIQNKYLNFVNVISQKDPGLFIAEYINSFQLPVVDADLSNEQKIDYLKKHSLDNVDFKNGELTNSDLFTAKTIEYLTYYRNPQLPRELLEKTFIPAIDTVLDKAKINYRVYKQIVEYLIDGFKKFGLDEDLNYVIENYVIKDDLCLDDKTEMSIQSMLNQDKALRINSAAPDIIMRDEQGKEVDLQKIKSDYTLILFYVSWCPHCQSMIPKLQTYLKNIRKHTKLKVLAISLDTSKADWLKFVKENKLSWTNLCDLKGWRNKAALDYYIYATPTMILLDKNKKIIGRPSTVDDLSKWF